LVFYFENSKERKGNRKKVHISAIGKGKIWIIKNGFTKIKLAVTVPL